MKISMILTSLMIATGAMSLSACNGTDKSEASSKSAAVIQESDTMKSDTMKNEENQEITPAPAPSTD